MSDLEIRRLEQALAADPSDSVALEALAAARTRAGRGWAGEALPRDLRCSARERGVYVWTRHGLGLELVRVPGTAGGEWIRGRGSARQVPAAEPAFFVGRFPVTRGEWLRWPTRRIPTGVGADQADHPVVNVTHADAVAFCSWAGLRLPTAAEWTRAAGINTSPQSCPDARTGQFFGSKCPQCVGKPCVGPRPYPWGNEAPTPERCVSSWWGPVEAGARNHGLAGRLLRRGRGTLPVRLDGIPARLLGASPCGAMDMVGHVFEFADVGPHVHDLMGSSFRRQREDIGFSRTTDGSDDTGFRVALSEPTA